MLSVCELLLLTHISKFGLLVFRPGLKICPKINMYFFLKWVGSFCFGLLLIDCKINCGVFFLLLFLFVCFGVFKIELSI